GVPYWDGGYSGNPAITPFLHAGATEDVLVVQLNPVERTEIPASRHAIMDRAREIAFNASLQAELRTVDFVNRLIDEGKLRRGRGRGEFPRLRLHRIALDDGHEHLDERSKLNTDFEFFERLHAL